MFRTSQNYWLRFAAVSAISFGCIQVSIGAESTATPEPANPIADLDVNIERLPSTQARAIAEIDASSTVLVAQEESSDQKTEVITERYPNRAVMIERHVVQDDEGNYFNHGAWSHWDEKGVLRGTGEYRQGKRHGKWVRWFNAGEGKMFAGTPYKYFQPPFVAEATFVEDKLDGSWTVLDSLGRKASEWHFANGQMHGNAVWYFPSGQKQREATYQQDQVEGHLLEWTLETPKRQMQRGQSAPQPVYKLVTKTLYIHGRREGPHVEHYAPGKKKVEGTWLLAKEVTQIEYDFWEGDVRSKIVSTEGDKQRRGLWTWYFPDGGKQLEGEFVADEPVGLHTWWHSNGQKMTAGEYKAGKEDGKWIWWHANGQKRLEGQFSEGRQIGHWISWNDEGKVIEVQDLDSASPTASRSDSSFAEELSQPTTPVRPVPIRIKALRHKRPDAALRR